MWKWAFIQVGVDDNNVPVCELGKVHLDDGQLDSFQLVGPTRLSELHEALGAIERDGICDFFFKVGTFEYVEVAEDSFEWYWRQNGSDEEDDGA